MDNIAKIKLINTFKILGFYIAITYIFNYFLVINTDNLKSNFLLNFLSNIFYVNTSFYDELLKSAIIQFIFLFLPILYLINFKETVYDKINNINNSFNQSLNLNFNYKYLFISLFLMIGLQFTNTYYLEIIKDISSSIGAMELITDYELKSNEQLIIINQTNIYFLIFTFAILPAIIEETLFRGYLLSSNSHTTYDKNIYKNIDKMNEQNYEIKFSTKFNTNINLLIISNLLFGLLHFNPLFFFQYFLIGMLLSYNYLKSQNLYQSILLHFINNLVVILNMKYFH